MWPWEHVAFGYLLYSVSTRVWTRDRPTEAAAVGVVVGTQFPDLVDKPLAWSLGVLPSGTSLAHSVFVAVPTALLAVLIGYRNNRTALGAAFGIGYLSHLVGDVIYPLVVRGHLAFGAVLWPLVGTSHHESMGIAPRVLHFLGELWTYLQSPAAVLYVTLEVTLLGTALVLWVADGTPGLGIVRSLVEYRPWTSKG